MLLLKTKTTKTTATYFPRFVDLCKQQICSCLISLGPVIMLLVQSEQWAFVKNDYSHCQIQFNGLAKISRGHATLLLAVSVGPSVGPLVRPCVRPSHL